MTTNTTQPLTTWPKWGKYAGQDIATVRADRNYVEWITAQKWFRVKFPNLLAALCPEEAVDESDVIADVPPSRPKPVRPQPDWDAIKATAARRRVFGWKRAKEPNPAAQPARVLAFARRDAANESREPATESREDELRRLIDAAPDWTPDGHRQEKEQRRRESARERKRRQRVRQSAITGRPAPTVA
jgi:hypothetical protein